MSFKRGVHCISVISSYTHNHVNTIVIQYTLTCNYELWKILLFYKNSTFTFTWHFIYCMARNFWGRKLSRICYQKGFAQSWGLNLHYCSLQINNSRIEIFEDSQKSAKTSKNCLSKICSHTVLQITPNTTGYQDEIYTIKKPFKMHTNST